MKDNQVLQHIKRVIDDAPIDILDNIKKQNIVKMSEHDDITRQEPKKISFKPIMTFASIAAVLLLFVNFQVQYRMADSQIYLDVNPSIQITTNRKDKVIGLESINQDAAEIVNNIEFKNKDVNTVAEEIVDSLVEHSYIDEANEVMLLSVYNKDEGKRTKQANELDDILHQKLEGIGKNPIILTQSIERSNTVEDYAKEYNISVGKMTFIRNMIILNPNLKTEDLVNLSLDELIKIFQEYELDINQIINKPLDPTVIEEKSEVIDNHMEDDDFDDDEDDDQDDWEDYEDDNDDDDVDDDYWEDDYDDDDDDDDDEDDDDDHEDDD